VLEYRLSYYGDFFDNIGPVPHLNEQFAFVTNLLLERVARSIILVFACIEAEIELLLLTAETRCLALRYAFIGHAREIRCGLLDGLGEYVNSIQVIGPNNYAFQTVLQDHLMLAWRNVLVNFEISFFVVYEL
jgi:hypothetical protein